jgi:hypothetical protein
MFTDTTKLLTAGRKVQVTGQVVSIDGSVYINASKILPNDTNESASDLVGSYRFAADSNNRSSGIHHFGVIGVRIVVIEGSFRDFSLEFFLLKEQEEDGQQMEEEENDQGWFLPTEVVPSSGLKDSDIITFYMGTTSLQHKKDFFILKALSPFIVPNSGTEEEEIGEDDAILYHFYVAASPPVYCKEGSVIPGQINDKTESEIEFGWADYERARSLVSTDAERNAIFLLRR